LILTKSDHAMARVHFTTWLRQQVPDSPLRADGGTIADVLTDLFAARPHLRGYLFDEQGRLRKHVCIFADGTRLSRDAALTHPVRSDSVVHIMQALSGG
jgi:hypothetical protein